jgi:hypothetical protein
VDRRQSPGQAVIRCLCAECDGRAWDDVYEYLNAHDGADSVNLQVTRSRDRHPSNGEKAKP